MAITHNLTIGWNNGGANIQERVAVTHATPAELNADLTVPATTTSSAPIAFSIAALQSLFVLSNANVTMRLNAADNVTTGQITMLASKPISWYLDSGITNPIATNVTALYFVNATAAAATINVRGLIDGQS